jgi:hypothetical protein
MKWSWYNHIAIAFLFVIISVIITICDINSKFGFIAVSMALGSGIGYFEFILFDQMDMEYIQRKYG